MTKSEYRARVLADLEHIRSVTPACQCPAGAICACGLLNAHCAIGRAEQRARDAMIDEPPGSCRVVIVESPYAANGRHTVDEHVEYARACLRDCFARGELPFASHLLYTQPNVLRDDDPEQRRLGIAAGLAIGERCDVTVVYMDLGLSVGMQAGIAAATTAGRPIEYRFILDVKNERG